MQEARSRYIDDNRATLRWILSRLPPGCAPAFIDTKLNPLTLQDYDDSDAQRGPSYVYDWIQGRGLEALCTHAAFFDGAEPELAAALDAASARVLAALRAVTPANGESSFCRGAQGDRMLPAGTTQVREPGLRCYGDIFVAKGLLAAAVRHGDDALRARQLGILDDIVASIEQARFLRDERSDLTHEALARQQPEYGPRMILLGAGALLQRLDLQAHDDFSARFVDHVLANHLDTRCGLIADAPGGSTCNVGHGIEMVGLAFEALHGRMSEALQQQLADVLEAHLRHGFATPGIALRVAVPGGEPADDHRPWWSLPEAIRATTLAYEATGRPELLASWQRADADYFTHYRRTELPIAYQTLTGQGAVDHVPATPDLDPAYHTGLSLLGAIDSVERGNATSPTTGNV